MDIEFNNLVGSVGEWFPFFLIIPIGDESVLDEDFLEFFPGIVVELSGGRCYHFGEVFVLNSFFRLALEKRI